MIRKIGCILALAVAGAAFGPCRAGETSWSVGERTVLSPAAASDVLRMAIASVPAPDVAAARGNLPGNDEEWLQAVEAHNAEAVKTARALAAQLGAKVEAEEIAGVTVRRVTPAKVAPEHRDHVFLHLHGGAYVFYGGESSVIEALLIATRVGIPVLSVDYRMPPLHPFPAAMDDTVNVYRQLLQERPAASIVLGGTSAGGGLTLTTVHKLIKLGLDLPAALFAGTPWSDLSDTGDSTHINEGIDRNLVTYYGILESAAKMYAGERPLDNPLVSPVYGNFKGFPPTYLVTGTRDLFLSHTVRVHRKLREAGVEADLNVYEGVAHADYLFLADSTESHQIFTEMAGFLLRHLGSVTNDFAHD